MKIIHSPQEMQGYALAQKRQGIRIGFVPTMGFLHEGHLSLMRLARETSDLLVVSIFVNPTQFGPGEDLAAYPRDVERDRALCEREAVAVLFSPADGEMYADDRSVWVAETQLSCGLCGASRPGHFRGVATVVGKLFNIVQPDVAVFGQKDAQQVRVIQRMVRDLDFPVQVVVAPIAREVDGLAMSSRNAYLSAGERRQATCLYRALQLAERLHAEGVREVATLRERMMKVIDAEPAARIDYIEMVDDETLQPVDRIESATLVALAVRIGDTRLIDNVVIPETGAA